MTFFFRTKTPMRVVGATEAEPLSRAQLRDLVAIDIRKRSLRHAMFDDSIVNDQAWIILQELFAAHLASETRRSKSICDGEIMPKSTVIRYLDHLEKFGLVTRTVDPDDCRAKQVRLTPTAVFWMEEFYAHMLESSGGPLKRVASSIAD